MVILKQLYRVEIYTQVSNDDHCVMAGVFMCEWEMKQNKKNFLN